MNIKELFLKLFEEAVVPIVDSVTKGWHTPFEIDDTLWGIIKDEVRKRLDVMKFEDRMYGWYWSGDITTGPRRLNDLFVEFIKNIVYPIIDDIVKNKHTWFEWDDKVWVIIKEKLNEYLSGVQINLVNNKFQVVKM